MRYILRLLLLSSIVYSQDHFNLNIELTGESSLFIFQENITSKLLQLTIIITKKNLKQMPMIFYFVLKRGRNSLHLFVKGEDLDMACLTNNIIINLLMK